MSKPPLNDVEGDSLLTGFHRESMPKRPPVQSCIIVSPPRTISEFEFDPRAASQFTQQCHFGGGLARRKGKPPLIVAFSAQTLGSKPIGRPDWNFLLVRPVMPGSSGVLPAPWLRSVIPLDVVSQ
jgi:hypothetical protein